MIARITSKRRIAEGVDYARWLAALLSVRVAIFQIELGANLPVGDLSRARDTCSTMTRSHRPHRGMYPRRGFEAIFQARGRWRFRPVRMCCFDSGLCLF